MTCSTILTLIRRVAVRSDCCCRLCKCVCVCMCVYVMSGRGQVGGGGCGWQVTKLRKKQKTNPKYLCHRHCVITCLSLLCPTSKRVQLEFTNRPRLLATTSTRRRRIVKRKREDPNYDPVSVFVSEDAVTPSGPLFRLISNDLHPGSEMCSDFVSFV